jgi:tetratricopeptide (TPR) repeat protein
MSCQQIYQSDFVEKYVRGEGSRGEREAFERHYFECQACYEKLRACRLLRAELQPEAVPWQGIRRRPGVRPRRAWVVAIAASLALVAVGIGLWSQRQRTPLSPPVPPVAEPGLVHPPSPEPIVSIADLARVEPPPYEVLRLRGPADEATKLFQDAMKRYAAADYVGAARGLERASRLDPQAPDPPFYLGICRLMLGDASAAVRELQRAVHTGDPASADEARFYLAKAHLKLEDVDAARRELRLVAGGGRERAAEARNILDQLEKTGAAGR